MIKTLEQRYDDVFPGEVNELASEAIPSQSLSVRDILQRFRRGTLSPDDIVRSVYNDEDTGMSEEFLDAFESATDLVDEWNLRHSVKLKIDDCYEQIRESGSHDQQHSGRSGDSGGSDQQGLQTGSQSGSGSGSGSGSQTGSQSGSGSGSQTGD